jgi:F0F1-type ATP synthase membrane subunit c/vacuolar-type H+-ATPase subunit K
MRKLAATTAFFLTGLAAQPAFACAVCFSGRDESRVAYLLTTIFMTSLPILALGVGIWWVVKKANAADSQPR